ncbi:MAG: pyrroloquinoline quinone biosynthesis protein PqqB [Rhodospirillales bacterium]|nr:pyrroloquinoline quinone biosynthesis protein PqqB [Rhodospirillales bacterium]
MRIVVLGSAAGGGFPQWNCACEGCRRARAGDRQARARTQTSVAVSADDKTWYLLNASPDIGAQLLRTTCLHPAGNSRHSPIAGVILTGAEVDAMAGLLSLRERQPFVVYAPASVARTVAANPVFGVLNPAFVRWEMLSSGQPVVIRTSGPPAAGSSASLVVEAFAVPGKEPLYLEAATGTGDAIDATAAERQPDLDQTIGLAITAVEAGVRMVFVPGCGAINEEVRRRIEGAALLFFDGTVWQDDELATSNVGTRSGRRMGHVPMWGEGGSIASLDSLNVGRRVFIHMNNTNPVLLSDSAEHALAREAGWEIAADGAEYQL